MKRATSLSVIVAAVIASQTATAAGPDEIRQLTPQVPLSYELPDDLVANPKLEEADFKIYTAGAHYFKRAITSTKPQTTTSEKFIPLPGAATKIAVPAGKNVLVNLAFTAESRCNELNSVAQDWCEVRIMVDGMEASPAASSFPPDTYAFDSTDSGSETTASWESHAMDRHMCIMNSQGDTTKVVPIEVDWKVTNFDGGVAPNFWLDDWSLTVELAQGCREQDGKFDQ
ncbi:hypothetical protein BTA51_11250 [Hahella sp. CCB-MM4]|uniref:hypothetical protein n=1 Tax=Hahella sp. (strain CCB-MM4) TaxID=1926491 RepID=UPI000B9BAFDB|nr:hypothetical protein [Hahella sp. CCB-MM4]OZG73067.1 hypothetical protein BTA51_11250 [Hahella sp. CCB-MM4]